MPRYLVHYEGAGIWPRLIDPEPQVGDTISFADEEWAVEKVQAPPAPDAMGRVWAKPNTTLAPTTVVPRAMDDVNQEWLKTPEGREWLQTDEGTAWFHSTEGQWWSQGEDARRWYEELAQDGWNNYFTGKAWQTPDGFIASERPSDRIARATH